MNCWFGTLSVDAINDDTLTCPEGPTTMPFGLTRYTWPLEVSEPIRDDGFPLTTRFSTAAWLLGRAKCVDSFAPIENPCHSITARSVD